MPRSLHGKIALVAGATRGAGRGIALALGEAGATVYCSGRSIRGDVATPGRTETIDETAELVTARGGIGIAVRTDHTQPDEVRALIERIRAEQGHLDILVNDVWGGDDATEWGKKIWEHSLEPGLRMQQAAVHSHIITSHFAIPLMLDRPNALIVEITDGVGTGYRGNVYYDLAKSSVIRLAVAQGYELRNRGVTAVAVTPGFLRSEAMLDRFGVTEANWRDRVKKDPHFAESETPLYVGRAVAALAADPDVWRKNGGAYSSWDLSDEYGFVDADGRRPHWGRYVEREVDTLWAALVAATSAQLDEGTTLEHDRKTLTLSAGVGKPVSRRILEPELFFTKPETLAEEFVGLTRRATQPPAALGAPGGPAPSSPEGSPARAG